MSLISSKILPKPKDKQDQDLYYVIENLINEVSKIINGGLLFSDNFVCDIVTHEFTTTDTEEEITHTLGSVPTMYLLANLSANSTIYNSGTAFTSSKIFLKSSALCTVTLIVL